MENKQDIIANYSQEDREGILNLINSCPNSAKCQEVISYIEEGYRQRNLVVEGYRWKSLVNHIIAMINREEANEIMEDIDETLFSESTQDAIQFAENVAKMIGNLPRCETLLLSVHFDTAKNDMK